MRANPMDEEVCVALVPWRQELHEFGDRTLGTTKVYLQQKECARGECNLGNFYTDAMLHAFVIKSSNAAPYWSNVSMALTTQGNFRVPLAKGNLTYSHLVAMCPWENKLYALTLKGHIIRELLEDSVAPMKPAQNAPSSSRFLQVAGIRVTYNISNAIGERVVDVKVRCRQCALPQFIPLDPRVEYRVVVMEYLANGKNGYRLISENAKDFQEGPYDLDAFIHYMQINEPIYAGLEDRIRIWI